MKIIWLVISLALTACTIGNGQICGPQTPQAYCNKEAYELLTHPKPYGAHWVKEGMTRESRLNEFTQCGGYENMREGYEIQPNQSNIDFFKGYNAHVTKVAACMRAKGYTYLEQCDANCLHP